MYGLVNKAIEDLICEKFGEEKWEEILEDADIDIEGFVSMQSYEDDVSFKLVGSISKILDIPANDVLKTFGSFWVTYTALKGYESLLKLTGESLEEFIFNIDVLHTRVAKSYPNLVPPKFTTHKISDNHYEITYESEREGLSPMVIGLLEGLGERFKKNIQVEQISFKDKNGPDKFSLKIVS